MESYRDGILRATRAMRMYERECLRCGGDGRCGTDRGAALWRDCPGCCGSGVVVYWATRPTRRIDPSTGERVASRLVLRSPPAPTPIEGSGR